MKQYLFMQTSLYAFGFIIGSILMWASGMPHIAIVAAFAGAGLLLNFYLGNLLLDLLDRPRAPRPQHVEVASPDDRPRDRIGVELAAAGIDILSKLEAAVGKLPAGASKTAATTLLDHGRAFVKHAGVRPDATLHEQRFITYYLPQALSLVEARLQIVAEEDRETMDKMDLALHELTPAFAHYAQRIRMSAAPDMDLELRLQRDAIKEDLQSSPNSSRPGAVA